MAQLAIKGHNTRGKEVIQLLEMLGGTNKEYWEGNSENLYYCIGTDSNGEEDVITTIEDIMPDVMYLTFEEFLEKFPYKVGDKVKCWINGYCSICNIRDMEWDGIVNEIKYKIQDYWYSTMNLQPYKDENVEKRKYSDLRLPLDDDDKLATEATIEGNKITPPENYLIGKITKVDNSMIVEFVKKQLQYPKTYKECCEVIGYRLCGTTIIGYKTNVLKTLQKLLICRDAYWKIAGEEMGLGKAWEQDYDDRCFIIANNNGNIHTYEYHGNNNVILAFPTEEMRNAFYENFKDLIEQCKELL